MAVVTALFMMPTTVVFPALLRLANTPPASGTLNSVKYAQYRIASERPPPPTAFDTLRSEYEEALKNKEDDYMVVLDQGEHVFYLSSNSNTCSVELTHRILGVSESALSHVLGQVSSCFPIRTTAEPDIEYCNPLICK